MAQPQGAQLTRLSQRAQIKTALRHLTPLDALEMLQTNRRNRRVNETHVKRLHHLMITGRWHSNGETIKFTDQGQLIDGQHRLLALSRIDDPTFTIPMLVVTGIDMEAQLSMDGGWTRSASEQLLLEENLEIASRDATIIIGALRLIHAWDAGYLFGDRKKMIRLSTQEVVEWSRENPKEISRLANLISHDMRKVNARPSLTLAVLYRLSDVDPDDTNLFMEYLYSGAGMDRNHPVLILRERLNRLTINKVRESDRDIIGFFIIAWNAMREGRTMSKFQRPNGGVWTRDNFPVPY